MHLCNCGDPSGHAEGVSTLSQQAWPVHPKPPPASAALLDAKHQRRSRHQKDCTSSKCVPIFRLCFPSDISRHMVSQCCSLIPSLVNSSVVISGISDKPSFARFHRRAAHSAGSVCGQACSNSTDKCKCNGIIVQTENFQFSPISTNLAQRPHEQLHHGRAHVANNQVEASSRDKFWTCNSSPLNPQCDIMVRIDQSVFDN